MIRFRCMAGALRVLGVFAVFASFAQGAQFEFGVLLQAGFQAANSSNWEVAVGDTAGATTASASLSSYWTEGGDRR